ncbi:MAG: phosphomannomutase/phosphoglucomutase [Actinobacteria bacterium]|nr:phosphomannomutase/phosphoglucomutase [Actinomycetota bacterium]MSZ58498.1 phosphomannomutase/phosphoglucomutase [Actinomycetota bacterium]
MKAYDVRGIVPDQLDADLAHDVGAAFVRVLGIASQDGGPGVVVIGHDMRPSGPDLVAAFADGVREQGCDVLLIGLASTDGLYFASGSLGVPGAMFTASHNPAQYNGIKLCRAGAAPVGQDTGLREIRDMIEAGPIPTPDDRGLGEVRSQDMLADYAAFLRSLVDISGIRPLKVVIDAGNGMGGYTVPAVLGGAAGLPALPLDIIPMYFELDGSFPNHEANPIEPANLVDLQARVLETGADLGLAFDGDADRCFVIDERGEAVSPSTLTALIAARELVKHPGASIIYNLITSKAVPEVVIENGGVPVRSRVGHSFIKATMAQTNAVFGGEHSGHFYFRDFWRADSGMLAALHAMAALGETSDGTPLSSLLQSFDRYASSGEINTKVVDQRETSERIREVFGSREGVTIDDLDGLTFTGDTWWFNVRPSNTEPLLRLNAEASDEATMERLRDEVLALMRAGA